jgi:short-subunit dehydrogenase
LYIVQYHALAKINQVDILIPQKALFLQVSFYQVGYLGINGLKMNGKVVVITGASSGIGRALAIEYARRGASLSLAARRTERLEEVKRELPDTEILAIRTDITSEADCRNLIELTIQHFGRIDVLINNAGLSMRALFDDIELTSFKKIMDVNFYGTVYCTKYALPYLLDAKGSLVGIISVAGHVALPARSAYTASKFATRGFLDTIRLENMYTGLHVLVVAPGFTASDIRRSALNANGTPQGETPREEEKMMSAAACAYQIANSIARRQRSLVLTFVEGKLAVFLGKIFPFLVDFLTYRHMAKEPDSPLSKKKIL